MFGDSDGDSRGVISYENNGDSLSLWTAGGEKVRIDSSGRMGIGTSSVDAGKLHILNGGDASFTANTTYDALVVENGTSAQGTALQLVAATNGVSSIGFSDSTRNVGQITYDHSGDYLFINTAGSERARIDSSGRLLVGTSTAADAAARSLVQIVNGSGPKLVIGNSSSGTYAADATAGELSFVHNSGGTFGEAARIEANSDAGTASGTSKPGRLVFSTTADGASSPTERMRIRNNGESYVVSTGLVLSASTTAAAGTTIPLFDGLYGGTAGTPGGGTRSVVIWSNGNIQNTNNSYTAISDIKLKENIVDANSQWADIKALQVRNFNFKEGQAHRQIGLIAQEVETVSPGLVYETPDRDPEGNDLGTTTKAVQYSVLYMKAVKALQEAMERIEALETKVAALEAA